MTAAHTEIYSRATDIVLESCDGVKFCAHKSILAAASAFFEQMFTLPQPPGEKDHPVISLSEHSVILGALLQFIYPEPDPEIETLDELNSLLASAVKYEFIRAIAALRKELVSPRFLAENPLRVYASASRFELEDEARIASGHTLCRQILDCPLSEDLKFISAYAYHRLLVLHRTRADAAQRLLKISDDVKCAQCSGLYYGNFVPPKWWKVFERYAREELAIRPTTEVIFSLPFLARVARECECVRCSGSMLDNHDFFTDLKRRIDELPSTV
ncbi:hypothetical protein EDC04DRAFT_1472907 [Pisolithus marmoratus]|nr:hypothetical protein EDC04DRAFT_1472907 [Pisolithus marmoratus]